MLSVSAITVGTIINFDVESVQKQITGLENGDGHDDISIKCGNVPMKQKFGGKQRACAKVS